MAKHPTEEKFPNQTKRFKEITENMYQVHLDKNLDYSPSNVLLTGMGGVLVRMWDKLSRIYNLMGVPMPHAVSVIKEAEKVCIDACSDDSGAIESDKFLKIEAAFQKIYDSQQVDFAGLKKAHEAEAANEPLVDAFEDLGNYSIIAMILAEREWGN